MPKSISQKKLDGQLIKALEKEDLSLAEKFLKSGANSNCYQVHFFSQDCSPTNIVLEKDNPEMLQLLITYGFNQNKIIQFEDTLYVPLILFAALHDNKRTLKFLAEDLKTDFNIEYSSDHLSFRMDMADEKQLLSFSDFSPSTLAIIRNAIPIRAEKERIIKQQKIRGTKFKF